MLFMPATSSGNKGIWKEKFILRPNSPYPCLQPSQVASKVCAQTATVRRKPSAPPGPPDWSGASGVPTKKVRVDSPQDESSVTQTEDDDDTSFGVLSPFTATVSSRHLDTLKNLVKRGEVSLSVSSNQNVVPDHSDSQDDHYYE